MADKSAPATQSWLASTVKRVFTRGAAGDVRTEVDDGYFAFADGVSIGALNGGHPEGPRQRLQIYTKYQGMLSDPVVSSAIRLHVTAALGGHETSGDVVFIEARAKAKGVKDDEAIVEDVDQCLRAVFNKVAMQVAFNGAGYGDAYARILSREKEGVLDLICDEMMHPHLVQPYEQGNKTRVCVVGVGPKLRETLTMDQIARLKMPRLNYVPQPMAVEKSWRLNLVEDDPDKLMLMPSLAGGSFLVDAESQYDNFAAALSGLVGQRMLDSIDETTFIAQVSGLSKEHRDQFTRSIRKMLERSKEVADAAVKARKPFMSRVRHILPVFNDKQILQIQALNGAAGSGSGRAGAIGIEDVLLHAKLLAGALGTDLTMLGFADQMSGGLGEGGFFRTSAQAAERSRSIRIALAEMFDHVADVHVLLKHGRIYPPGQRPWQVNFYGTISALESERQRTAADAMNTGALFVQTLTQARDLGIDEKALEHFMSKILKLDEDAAKLFAKALVKAKPPDQGGGFGGGFGGGEEPMVATGGTVPDGGEPT